jgi:hypothetical protein
MKGNVIADHLADHAMEDYELLNFVFLMKMCFQLRKGNQIVGLCILMVLW